MGVALRRTAHVVDAAGNGMPCGAVPGGLNIGTAGSVARVRVLEVFEAGL